MAFEWLKQLHLPESEEPDWVLLISSPATWSPHVETFLTDRDIPFVKRAEKGAGVTLKIGPVNEVYDYYVPREAYDKAAEDLDELRAQIGN
ncbi:MAG: hypothetical protein ACOYH4_05765 [Saccharofermentanales bacterium]|jgi:hypothetical protein